MSRRGISGSLVWLAVVGLLLAGGARGESSFNGVLEDPVSGLVWTATDNGSDIPWSEAEELCRGLALDGVKGWRLASIDELETLVDRRGLPLKVVAGVDLSAFWVWSDEPHESLVSRDEERPMAWFLSFLSGKPGVTHADRSEGLRTLCVR